MARDSFEKQFPNYAIVPEKKNVWIWPLTWLAFIALISAPIFFFKNYSYNVPTPSLAGANDMTLPTLKQLAILQVEGKNLNEASSSLARYFALGGQEADMMALYASVLSQAGRKNEALPWSRKATAKDPRSKAARIVRDSL